MRIEWQGRLGVGVYDGEIGADEFAGTFTQGSSKGTFRAKRVAISQPAGKAYHEITGSYQFAHDHFIDIAPFAENEDRPIFFDSKSRRVGVLYAVSPTEFFTGPSWGILFPADIVVKVTKGGISWTERGVTKFAKRRAPQPEQEITFRNGDVVLKGTLTLPPTPGKHPALVLVHGSGPERRPAGFWAPYFARQGIAYLYFDKRGAGASTGDWNNATLNDLAADVLAGVRALKANPAIDGRHIGLIGHSNGGWVAPLAASQSSDVAFLIVKSGSALPVADNIVYELEMDMRGVGEFSEEDIANAKGLRALLNRALLTNTGWDELMAAIDRSKNEKWFQYARVQWLQYVQQPLDSERNPLLAGFRKQIDFDPSSTWNRIRCPTLVLLGALDANTPTRISAPIIENALRRNGNPDFTVRVLQNANHGLFQAKTGYSVEAARLTTFVPGYMEVIAGWVLRHTN